MPRISLFLKRILSTPPGFQSFLINIVFKDILIVIGSIEIYLIHRSHIFFLIDLAANKEDYTGEQDDRNFREKKISCGLM